MDHELSPDQIKELAAQLRKPQGEYGIEVGIMMNEGNEPINLHTIAVLNPQISDCILEIGMGNGFFVNKIVSLADSVQYTGCDYSELMVQEAKERNRSLVAQNQAQFLHASAEDLPFENESFNKLFTINTLYFWEDASKVLSEFKRILKPEGSLIISIRPRHNLELYPVTEYGFKKYSKADLENLLIDNGFKPVEITEIKEPLHVFNGSSYEPESVIIKSIIT